jgi:hypothetical protein
MMTWESNMASAELVTKRVGYRNDRSFQSQ